MGTLVTETLAASCDVALRHFEGMLAFERLLGRAREPQIAQARFHPGRRPWTGFVRKWTCPRSHQHPSRPDDRVADGRVSERQTIRGLLRRAALQRCQQSRAAPRSAWVAGEDDDRRYHRLARRRVLARHRRREECLKERLMSHIAEATTVLTSASSIGLRRCFDCS